MTEGASIRHTNVHIEPARRRRATRKGYLLFLVIVALASVVVAYFCTSSSIAVGHDDGAKSETINDIELKVDQTSFVDEAKNDIDILQKSATRDVSELYSEISIEQEEKRKAEEEAARKRERECIDNANARKEACGATGDGIDFNIGKSAFVDYWGSRIDKYLQGSEMQGCGKIYAAAAFEYGMDPRVSPAISNTESGKGSVCFRPHNAWGWMGSAGWSDWESAINAHVKGLSEGYSYTISLSFAQKYCPPTYQDWYSKTLAQLNSI